MSLDLKHDVNLFCFCIW